MACSTLTISIGLRISPTMMSKGAPVPLPCIKQSASVVLSQLSALLSPSRVEILKPFCCKKVRFISCCVYHRGTPFYLCDSFSTSCLVVKRSAGIFLSEWLRSVLFVPFHLLNLHLFHICSCWPRLIFLYNS